MRKFVSVLLLCFTSFALNAQNFSWVKGISTTKTILLDGTATDSAGNVYITGLFTDTMDFDPGPAVFNLITNIEGDAFIAKYNATGDLQWAQSVGGAGMDRGISIDVDKSGFIYVTGSFRRTADLDPGPSVLNFTAQGTNISNGDIFTMKLTNAGTLVWVKTFGGNFDDETKYIQADASGNVIFLSKVNGISDYDPGPGVYNLGGYGPAIAKLDPNGNFVWAGAFQDFTNTHSCKGTSFGLDAAGNIYLTGFFAGSWDFNPSYSQDFSLTGYGDIFIGKLLSNGTFGWAIKAGGNGMDEGTQIAVDSAANVYVTGYLSSNFDFDPGPGTDLVTYSGHTDFFLWKVSSMGIHKWVRHIKGTGQIWGRAIDVDWNDNVYVTGHYYGTVDINPGIIVQPITATGNGDQFVAKFSPNGDQEWAVTTSTSTPTWIVPQSLRVIDEDQVVMTGSFSGTVDFDPGSAVHSLTGIGVYQTASYKNVYIWKLTKSGFVSGRCFLDANGDGVMQDSEFGITALVKGSNSNQELYTLTDTSGKYKLRSEPGTCILTVPLPPYYQSVLPATHTAVLDTIYGSSVAGKDFGLKPAGNINDLEITLTALTNARPGRQSMYRLSYTNHGTTILSDSVKLVLDNRMSFTSSVPGISGQNGNTITWNYYNLRPTQTGYIDIICELSNTTPAGSNLNYLATINPVAGDTTPLNNSTNLVHMVTGSFDPNDKRVEPSGDIAPTFISQGKKLDYTIRFQNTGNDTAFVVIIRDTLSNLLEWSSIEMVSASHNYTMDIDKNGGVEWRFNDIMLPDSNVNEVESHGFIRYRIKPKSSLALGETIKNKASIYFDFNLPVLTNETQTLLNITTSIMEVQPGIVSKLYPNPGKQILYLETPGMFSYILFDVGGRIIESRQGLLNKTTLQPNKMAKGSYFLKVITSNGTITHKILIQ